MVPTIRLAENAGPMAAALWIRETSTPLCMTALMAKLSSTVSRGSLTVGSRALTASTSPNHWRRASIRCEPEAPSHPPPDAGSNHQPGMAKERSIEMNDAPSTSLGVPTIPESIAHSISAWSGDHRNSCPEAADDAGGLGCSHQLLGLGDVEGEGLLAQDVAARRDGLGGQWRVRCRRPGDGDHIDPEVERLPASEVHAWSMPRRSARRAVQPDPRPPAPPHRTRPARKAGTWMRAPNAVPTTPARRLMSPCRPRPSPVARSAGGQPSTRLRSAQNGWLSISVPFRGGSLGSLASQAVTSPQTSGGAA